MPNNSKSPSQTQPSTLDIVLRNGQMNLATAIGRLEQAVTKAYGNINSSINSKQGEFNQALLKTLDQSISQSSNKMDQFYTSSFAKIYALNSAIMEQSLQKNGMAAAQKDLEGYRNYDKLFENQQRAFGDINFSLQQIIERLTPFDENQNMVENADFIRKRNIDYHDFSAILQTTDLHYVDRADALRHVDDVNTNLFQKRNTKEFTEHPLMKALAADDEGAVKELQNATNLGDFWVILVEKLSKAKAENKEQIMREVQKFFKTDSMVEAVTDPRVRRSRQDENPKDNFWDRAQQRGKHEENVYFGMQDHGYLMRHMEAGQSEYLLKILENLALFYIGKDKENKEIIENTRDKSVTTVISRIKESYSKLWGNYVQDSNIGSAIQQTGDFLGEVIPGVSSATRSTLNFVNWSSRNVATPLHGNDASSILGETLVNGSVEAKRMGRPILNHYQTSVVDGSPLKRDVKNTNHDIPIMPLNGQKNTQNVIVNLPRGLFLPPSIYNQKPLLPLPIKTQNYDSKRIELLQNNRNLQKSYSPSITRQGITVHYNNKFVTTISGDNSNPQVKYSNFTSSVNKILSNLTSEAISQNLGVK